MDISPVNYRFVVVGEIMKQIYPAVWLDRKEYSRRAGFFGNGNMCSQKESPSTAV